MKFKVYSMVKEDRVDVAINEAVIYMDGLIELSPAIHIKSEERKDSLYEILPSWSLLVLNMVKSIKTSYLQSFDREGCDGVILFVDKKKGLEDSNLFGQHTRVDGISYIEVYTSSWYYKKIDGAEGYSRNKVGSIRSQITHTLIHELMHAYSDQVKIPDMLHVFITENQFDSYLHYLKTANKNMDISPNAKRIYETALACLETDVTPKDEYPDSVSCAITVNRIYQKTFGTEIGGGASTYWLYNALLANTGFEMVDIPKEGDIVISPTGYAGKGGTIPNGHTGICGKDGLIMSNDSATGLFKQNYTISTWYTRYVEHGHFPMKYFRRK